MSGPTTTEPVLILRWLNSILTTDSVLNHSVTGVKGQFHRVAPANALSPFGIVRQETAAEDLTGLDGGGLIWVPVVMQVNLYDRVRGDLSVIDPLAARIYTLLHAQVANVSGGIVFSSRRLTIRAGQEQLGDLIEQFIEQRFSIEAKAE